MTDDPFQGTLGRRHHECLLADHPMSVSLLELPYLFLAAYLGDLARGTAGTLDDSKNL